MRVLPTRSGTGLKPDPATHIKLAHKYSVRIVDLVHPTVDIKTE